MPKLPRITANALIKYLIHKGFIITNRTGSHTCLKRKDVLVTVPSKNKIVPIGLLLDILADAGITRKEFIADYHAKIIK